MSYSIAAIKAAEMLQQTKTTPELAWERAVRIAFPNSKSSQEKPCPKNTFLALCETGKLKGIKPGIYTNSDDNKRYAIKALRILSNNTKDFTPAALWTEVLQTEPDKTKKHNSQMNVVIALVNNGLISN
jgi:hypothetical protein